MLFEAFFKDGGLVLGEAELLTRALAVLLVADTPGAGAFRLVLLRTGNLAVPALPADAGNGAVGRRRPSFLLALPLSRRRPVHVDSSQQRSLRGSPLYNPRYAQDRLLFRFRAEKLQICYSYSSKSLDEKEEAWLKLPEGMRRSLHGEDLL